MHPVGDVQPMNPVNELPDTYPVAYQFPVMEVIPYPATANLPPGENLLQETGLLLNDFHTPDWQAYVERTHRNGRVVAPSPSSVAYEPVRRLIKRQPTYPDDPPPVAVHKYEFVLLGAIFTALAIAKLSGSDQPTPRPMHAA